MKYICKKIEESAKENGNKKDADIAQKLINDYPSGGCKKSCVFGK